MRKFVKISLIIILALAVYSLIPTAALYLKNDPVPYTNEQAAEKLKNNKGEYFSFIAFGDNHAGLIFNDSATLKLVKNINREDRFKKTPIDFVVSAGDVTFRGSKWDYSTYNKIRSLINRPVISAMGNHDDDSIYGKELFKKYIGGREMSFINRNSYFIVINNPTNDLNDKQFSWLEEELKRSSGYKHTFIIIHKGPRSSQLSWYRPEISPWSYRFMKLCEDYKVDMVLSGHEHIFFKHKNLGGVDYVTTSGGGMLITQPKEYGGFLHYIVVNIYGDYVNYEVRKIFPPLWEYLAYYFWRDVFYFLKKIVL